MAYRSLREFLAKLEAAGELVRVTEPVSSVLEMTEIQRRLLEDDGQFSQRADRFLADVMACHSRRPTVGDEQSGQHLEQR